MAFSNQVIKPLRDDKPHIVKLEGLYRVSPYSHKKLWRTGCVGLWNEAHAYVRRQNELIYAEQEAVKERQREWKRLDEERELLAKEDLTAYENEMLNSQYGK